MLTGPINHNLESLEPRAPAYLFSLEYFYSVRWTTQYPGCSIPGATNRPHRCGYRGPCALGCVSVKRLDRRVARNWGRVDFARRWGW
jgi:hypothetical protein